MQLAKPKINLVLTRSVEQIDASIKIFDELGINVIPFPTIKFAAINVDEKIKTFFREKTHFDFLIFSSAQSVIYFSEFIKKENFQFDNNLFITIAIGKKTATVCGEHNFKVDLIPTEATAKGIFYELFQNQKSKKTVVIPRSAIGRDELITALKELEFRIIEFPIYDVTLPDLETIDSNKNILKETKIDWFAFTSPSTFENFLKIMEIRNVESFFVNYKIAAIGPTTKAAIKNYKIKVHFVPDEYNLESLAKGIINFDEEKK